MKINHPRRALWLATIGLLSPVAVALGFQTATRVADENQALGTVSLTPSEVRGVLALEAIPGSREIATAIIPGPLTSFNITLYVQNELGVKVTEMTFDPFTAMKREGLLVEAAWNMGLETLCHYPVLGFSGRGPIVASFTSFDPQDIVTFSMDPDTYGDPSFGAIVQDLFGARIELAFEDGTRGVGILARTDRDNAVARVFQTYPATDPRP